MGNTIFINKADGDDIIAFMKNAVGDVVTTRGVLIVGATDLTPIDIGDVGIEEGAEVETGGLGCLLLGELHMLTEPNAANNGATTCFCPFQRILINGRPLGIVVVGGGKMALHTRV